MYLIGRGWVQVCAIPAAKGLGAAGGFKGLCSLVGLWFVGALDRHGFGRVERGLGPLSV